MSEETNRTLVQDGYAKFGNGDIPGLLDLFADDINWTTPKIENAPFGGALHGREEVAEFFKLLDESEDITRFEPLQFIAEGDRVAVHGESAATVKSTGSSYETEWVHIFSIRDGKVTTFHEFFDNAAAITRAFQKTAAA